MNPIRSRTIISVLASLALGSLMASPALGAISASPNPSTTGSYTVSGSESTSATFHFFQLHETGPDDATATFRISDLSNISQSFSGKAAGTYTYQVQGCRTYPRPGLLPRCTDIGDSLTVTVTSAPTNVAPVASAGADQTVRKRASVTLDGSGSSDDDDATLTYAWSQGSGTTVTLSSTTAESPTFTAPATTGALVFSLTVNDGTVDSTADSVTVTVTNTRPVADAGSDQTGSNSVTEGASVTLDGSGSSDADGDTLAYAWSQTSGTSVSLSSATAASPTFTAPELLASENLVFSLTVNDGTVSSTADSVTVRISADNDLPTANAGTDQTVNAGSSVTLSASGADPESQTLTYAWSQTSGTTVTLSSTTAASPTFTAPSAAATLVFSLIVNDGVNDSTADTVTVTVQGNTAPVANAGADKTIRKRASVSLDGSGSTDADA